MRSTPPSYSALVIEEVARARRRARGRRRPDGGWRSRCRLGRQRPRQPLPHRDDALHGAPVGLVYVAVLDEGVGHHRDGALQVVEDEHRVGDEEGHLGQSEVVRGRVGQTFEVAHEVVGEVADEAAGERRQVAARRRPVRLEQLGRGGERVVVLDLRADRSRPRCEYPPLVAHQRVRAHAEEGVTAHPLAVLGALKEERARRRTELEERRDGGLEV